METGVAERPAVRNLLFHALDRPLHPELIDSITTRQLNYESYALRLDLTAAGHVLCWRGLGGAVVETLAEQQMELPTHRQLFTHRLGGERTEQYTPHDGVRVASCFQLERLAPEVFARVSDELRRDANQEGVLLAARGRDRLGLSPLSYAEVLARRGGMIIKLFHTYPAENAIVKTQTLIEHG